MVSENRVVNFGENKPNIYTGEKNINIIYKSYLGFF